jgi:protein arginine kinase
MDKKNLAHNHPWTNDKNGIWLSLSLSLARNLAAYRFPHKLSPAESNAVLSTLSKSFKDLAIWNDPTAIDKELLFEHFLNFESFQATHPGLGFLTDASGHCLALINQKNHLELHLISSPDQAQNNFQRLYQIEADIEKKHPFAYSQRFGYLTIDPRHAGTALRVAGHIHLPALIQTQKLHEVLALDDSLIAIGLEGSLNDLIGDILIIYNRYTLGVSEESSFHNVQSALIKLANLEKNCRLQLKPDELIALKDHVSRAFGLLAHSYQLQTKETLDALSLLKLGVDLKWVEGIAQETLNRLFFQSRRGHLMSLDTIDANDLPRKRAELIHGYLEKVTLIG